MILEFIDSVVTTCSAARYGCMPAGPVIGYPGARYAALNAAEAEREAQRAESTTPSAEGDRPAAEPSELVHRLLAGDGIGTRAEEALDIRLPKLTQDCIERWLQEHGRHASIAEIAGVLLAHALVRAEAAAAPREEGDAAA